MPPMEKQIPYMYYPKCTFFFCTNLEDRESAPFEFKCEHCEQARYCSEACMDRDPHDRVCNKSVTTEAEAPAPKEGCTRCSNCLLPETKKAQFKKCARCRKAKYCSVFCSRYDWNFGVHKLRCSAASASPGLNA